MRSEKNWKTDQHEFEKQACAALDNFLESLEGEEFKIDITGANWSDEYGTEAGEGWSFGPEGHTVPGTDRRVRWLHELYTIADPTCTTRVTVPTLWDAQTRRVVNNESSEIIRMFNSEFAAMTGPTPDYCPQHLRAAIDETNAFVLRGINNAVNGCGYSISQEAYDEQVALLFATLDALEERLVRQRYLCGDVQTEADWRLFPSLVRFDAVYYVAYKCNLRRLEDYPNLSNYLRELYQTPGIAAACDIAGMKRGVFSKAGPVGANGIVPVGPIVDHTRPHDRERLAAKAAVANRKNKTAARYFQTGKLELALSIQPLK